MPAVATVEELRAHLQAARQSGRRIGCVPTMGALHAGHLSLVEAARRETDFVVVTIFVNPTQFGPQEDFTKYPRPLERDLELCRDAGVDLVFHPEVATVYPTGATTSVDVGGVTSVLEGAFRPGHFRGVATIVLKLFNMVQPDVAFFGQKDFQQQLVIKQMVRDLDVPVRVQTCPTKREADGLAMSSRNIYLSPTERQTALRLSQALQLADRLAHDTHSQPSDIEAAMRQHLESEAGVQIDYAVLVDPQTLTPLESRQSQMVALIAARVGTTRLIDNLIISISSGSPEIRCQ